MIKAFNYEEAKNKFIKYLDLNGAWSIATSHQDQVTVRMIHMIHEGTTMYFQGGSNTDKIQQIEKNNQVALNNGNHQILARAEILGPWSDNQLLAGVYKANYEKAFNRYSVLEGTVAVRVVPYKCKVWYYINKQPVVRIIDFEKERAYIVDYLDENNEPQDISIFQFE